MQNMGAGATLERVGVDILGPFPETDRGNRFIIVVGDYWTKWTEAYSTPNHTAETVAKALVNNFIARFGIPEQLHSDQGREFEGLVFKQMSCILQIEKTRTTPWRPCSNGLVEGFNKTLGTMLRRLTSENQRDWDEYVDLVVMAYRSTVHESTGQTPNMMMLGRELPMPSHLLVATPDQKEEKKDVKYIEELQRKFTEVHALAREKLKKSHIHQKKYYDRTSTRSDWQAGTAVWLFNPTKRVGRSPKLMTFWEETPYVVVEKINDVVMKVQKSRNSKPRIIHVDRLKKVEGEVDISWYKSLMDGTKKMQQSNPITATTERGQSSSQVSVMEEINLLPLYGN